MIILMLSLLILVFTIKETKLHISVVTLSAKDNQELSKPPKKGSERSVFWNEYETKSENENVVNNCRYFLKSKFLGVNRLFVLNYSNEDNKVKKDKAKKLGYGQNIHNKEKKNIKKNKLHTT